MSPKDDKHTSKFMSLVLRHAPQTAGLQLDGQGWVPVADLVAGMNGAGHRVTREDIERIVATSDKQRFAFSGDGEKIRASQGHSISVDLAYTPTTPPELLYHGTATRFLESILAEGLHRRSRQHVHLSVDPATAVNVGSRHGKPVVLQVASAEMHADGHAFYLSANGVWLTEQVPPVYLSQLQF